MNTVIYAKYVYLFEMDSARTSPDQVKLAVRALYHETIVARNIVVLSYNQVVDSIPFISMLKEENSFKDILHLFELGYLKLNQYGNTRTIIQYLLDQLDRLLDASADDNSAFQFSGFPVKQSQRRLLALIRRCLVNSDLSEIYEYINHRKTDEEIRDLFLQSIPVPGPEKLQAHPEYAGYDNVGERTLVPASDSTPELVRTLKTIAVILEHILKLSAIRGIYLPPKKALKNERRSFSDFLNLIMERPDLIPEEQYQNALEVIRGLSAYQADPSDPKKHGQSRSEYLNELKDMELAAKDNALLKGSSYEGIILQYRYAETVINTCYNYTCEASILNISRHYDVIEDSGLLVPEKESFYADCRLRIQENMASMESFMQRKVSEVRDSAEDIPKLRFPRLEHLQKPDGRILYCEAENFVPRYEYKANVLYNRTKLSRIFDFPEVLRNFLLALALLILVNIGLDFLQQFMEFPSTPGWVIVKCLCALLAGELVSGLVAKVSEDDLVNVLLSFIASLVLPISVYLFAGFLQNAFGLHHPAWTVLKFVLIILISLLEAFTFVITGNRVVYEGSLFEIVGRFIRFLGNEFYNFHHFETSAHTNPDPDKKTGDYQCISVSEPTLPLPETRAMKRYEAFVRENRKNAFADPDTASYRFFRRQNEDQKKDLYRYEEITGRKFGLLYQSDYSTLLADPVLKPDTNQNIKNLMTYERVLPGKLAPAGPYDGVVVIPRFRDRYVLISQFRHAIRRDQLCFPRGFAECTDIREDAVRELREEIQGAVKDITSLRIIGTCTADSGLSSKTTAVVLADLDSVGLPDDPDEAIRNSGMYTADDLFAMIDSGEIDDGFTITAAMFLKLELQHMRP